MAITAVSLVEGSSSMVLYPRDNLVLMRLDVPGPAVRAVVEARPDADGETDTTARYGGRAVVVELMTIATPAAFVDEVTAFAHPLRRPYLVVTDDEWDQVRRLRLRTDQFSAPLSAENSPDIRTIQIQWRAPDGVWESNDERSPIITADVPSSVGFSAPLTAPLALTATLATGAQTITNPGNAPSHWTARLYGPCTAPRIFNDLTGEQLSFASSLILAAGEYVEIDTQNRTAYLLSDTSQSRLGDLDFGVSSWWQIQPGTQQVRYVPTSASAGSQAELTYRPVWL